MQKQTKFTHVAKVTREGELIHLSCRMPKANPTRHHLKMDPAKAQIFWALDKEVTEKVKRVRTNEQRIKQLVQLSNKNAMRNVDNWFNNAINKANEQ